MEAIAHKSPSQPLLSKEEQLRAAREIIRLEAVALWKLSGRLDETFHRVVEQIYQSRGSLIVTGMGKAGLIGQKIAATMASVGTRAHFLHPAEAFHGDLGRIHADDVVLMLSQSGETSEVVQLLPAIHNFGVPLIAITGRRQSTIGRAASEILELGALDEACSLGLAPSTSTTAMLALGDALALVLCRLRGFQAEDFARFHPGGSLGRRFSKVDTHMRPLEQCRVTSDRLSVREVLVACSRPGRRTGAIMLTDQAGRLTGLFTDSDLARLFEQRAEAALDRPVHDVMIVQPITVETGSLLRDAVGLMTARKISELPVVDGEQRPLGVMDVTDLVGMEVAEEPDPSSREETQKRPPAVRLFAEESEA